MTGIERARWEVVSPLLDELLEADPEQCAARLAQISKEDPALADQLAGLLAQESTIERKSFLSGDAFAAGTQPETTTLTGLKLGGYTIEAPLGKGGMGSVWLARRSDGLFAGTAAVKFLHLVLLARDGAERFRREGNVLARLTHPNIARLLDAGVTESTQPYLILEYVDGLPIDRWCDARGLDLRARLRLFRDVLAAVAHAHNKLILHRDLKPANILVTVEGQVKLLDFGIAKLLVDETQPEQATSVTHLSGHAFTPEYAAPEQVQGGDMTTATDVYALGVVLYELLTATRPYKVKRVSAAAIEQAVTHQDAPLASTVAAVTRRRELRGDLDAILNRALKKQPAERYSTVRALADDIERYLDGRPVQAQPDRLGYRMAKFIVRNRLAVGVAAAVLLAVLAGSGVSLWQARVAASERDRALALVDRNEATTAFLWAMINEFPPIDEKRTIIELLDQSERQIEESLRRQPEHQASFLQFLAAYHQASGNHVRSAGLLERAAELARDSRDLSLRAEVECNHALSMAQLGHVDAARKIVTDWLTRTADDPVTAVRCQLRLVQIATGVLDAQSALAHALAAQAQLSAAKRTLPLLEAEALNQRGWALYLNGRNDEAVASYESALKIYAVLDRRQHPAALAALSNWATAAYAAGDLSRALARHEEAQSLIGRWNGRANLPPASLLSHATVLAALGQGDLALQQADRAPSTKLPDALNLMKSTQLGGCNEAREDLGGIERRRGPAGVHAGTGRSGWAGARTDGGRFGQRR